MSVWNKVNMPTDDRQMEYTAVMVWGVSMDALLRFALLLHFLFVFSWLPIKPTWILVEYFSSFLEIPVMYLEKLPVLFFFSVSLLKNFSSLILKSP